ncbi:sodium-dependent transporter [Sinisalibacter lacisalsi]|uniref:Sodium-dependent transporter n=1 Tax=Sinisalibacter lacisalsi TaxID=1526570 RepID=A0ABQ1QTQ6_9RHOB|nr:sodium-dependent transporter [Sinisalibacter lacisalsi]GGD41765.1 sodium-dependent transporter [Sinisalibacter lacisalsi]
MTSGENKPDREGRATGSGRDAPSDDAPAPEPTPRPQEESGQAAAEVTDTSREAAERGEQPYAVWSSERAFVLSTAAAGVGLGNLWRFPTLVGENGGGVFLFAYAVAVIVVAIPFATLELAVGRQAQGSVIASFKRMGPGLFLFGWLTVLLTLAIDSYYFVVSGWTLGFATGATFGPPPEFESFTSGYASLWYLFAIGAIVAAILAFGLSGIERVAQFLMPLLVLSILALAVLALVTGEAGKALTFLFLPETERLGDPALWRAAFGQAFFSMTIGQGYLITYGSYLPDRIRLPRSVVSIAALNSGVAILAGLAIFPLVFAAGADPAAGSELAFVTLPRAFEAIGTSLPLDAVFFWLLFLAALSSCIGGAKVVTAALREQWPRLRHHASTLLGVGLIVALGIPSALSYAAPGWTLQGDPVLDVINRSLGSTGTIVLAIGTSLILGWRFSGGDPARPLGLGGLTGVTLRALVRAAPIALAFLFVAELFAG